MKNSVPMMLTSMTTHLSKIRYLVYPIHFLLAIQSQKQAARRILESCGYEAKTGSLNEPKPNPK